MFVVLLLCARPKSFARSNHHRQGSAYVPDDASLGHAHSDARGCNGIGLVLPNCQCRFNFVCAYTPDRAPLSRRADVKQFSHAKTPRQQWFAGPPPSIGWWPTSYSRMWAENTRVDRAMRWWDGREWSCVAYPGDRARRALMIANIPHPWNPAWPIFWTDRPASWPDRSRT